MRILVVEDEKSVRRLFLELLPKLGHRIYSAADGDEAIKVFERWAEQIDLVLLDAIIPKTGSGEVYEYIRRKKPGMRFMFTSGYNEVFINQKFELDPSFVFLRKPFTTQQLTEKIQAALEQAGHSVDVVTVPGALEIPAAISFALRADEMRRGGRPSYDAYVALGCVIRGETGHYDHVCNECMRGLSHMVNNHSIALGNGVLTVENFEQAWDRALVDKQDKGGGAAKAALDMIALKRQLSAP